MSKETKQDGVKVTIRLSEVNQFYQSMKGLKGILDNKKAIRWGRDLRLIKEKIDELTDFQEIITTSEFKSMQEEFTKLSHEAKDKTNAEIIKSWDKGTAYLKAIQQFEKQYNDHMKEHVTFDFKTKFEPENIHKIEDGATAEMLSYFMD